MAADGGGEARTPPEGVARVVLHPVLEGSLRQTAEEAGWASRAAETLYRIKPTASLGKVMGAFCRQFQVDGAAVLFAAGGQELQADQTPAALGWSSDRDVSILVRLRAEAPPQGAEPGAGPGPAAVADQAPRAEKVSVRVVPAPSSEGRALELQVERGAAFEETMQAYCRESGAPREAVRFLCDDGRELSPQDTPASCGWSAAFGALTLRAVHAGDGPRPATAAADGPPGGAVGAAIAGEAAAAAAPPPTAASPPRPAPAPVEGSDVKVLVQVYAVGADGEMVVDFKTGMGRPLGKLMAAWCRHCGVPEGEARFELAGRAERLRPSDTLQGLGVGAAGQPVRIDAVPDGADGPADDPTAELAAEQAARREPGGAEQAPALLPPAAIPAEAAVGSPPPGSEPQGRRPPEQASGATGGGPAGSGGAASGGGAAPPPTGLGGGGARGAAAAPGPGKVTVQVVATAADGELAQLDFRMRPEATFSKLMVAWCRENQVDVGAAAFFLEESRRELAPEDSPASIGCGLVAGVLRLRAEPRGGPGAEGFAEQAPPPEAPQPRAPDLREAAAGPAVKVEGEKVLVQVVAESEDGQLVVDFTVKRDTPLRKVMEAWCNHNGLDVGAALFRLDDEGGGAGREVRPEDTLASLGCRPEPGAGAVVLRAQPRDEDGPEAAASSGAAAAAAAGGRPPAAEPPAPAAAAEGHGPPLAAAEGRGPPGPEEKLQVRVLAQGEDGDRVTTIKMRLSMPFEKMMSAWCSQHGVERSEALFQRSDGTSVRPSDSPLDLGLRAADGPLVLTAVPAAPADGAPPPPAASAGPAAGAPAAGPEALGGAPAAAEAAAAAAAEEKVSVQVLAQGSDGTVVTTYKMKAGSPFGKFMSAWCSHHGIPEPEASFLHGDAELLPTQCALDLGWRPGGSVLTVHAMPREAASDADATTASGGGAVGSGAPPPDERVPEAREEPGLGPPAPAREGAAGASCGQLCDVRVVSAGRPVSQFRLKLSTKFGKMIHRWCETFGEGHEDVVFRWGRRNLGPEDTPAALGWAPTAEGEEVEITAAPRGAAAPAARQKRAASAGAGAAEEPAVKRPATAYSLWAKRRRAGLLELQPELRGRAADQNRQLAAEWKALPEAERRPFEEEAARGRPAGAAAAARAAAPAAAALRPGERAAADGAPEHVRVVVRAWGADGPSELTFNLKQESPMRKVIQAWCQRCEIPEAEAEFIHEDTLVCPSDRPIDLGGGRTPPEVVVTAVPKGSPEALKARPRARAASSRAAAGADPAAPPARRAQPVPASPPPKRPASGYMLFANERRPGLLAARPELKGGGRDVLGEVAKALGTEWKELGEEARAPYERRALELRAEYTEKKLEYLARHPEVRRAAPRRVSAGAPASRSRRTLTSRADTDDEDSGPDDASADAGGAVRRSSRLRETPLEALAAQTSASVMIQHPPPELGKRRRTGDLSQSSPGSRGEQHMSYREYLSHDREQDRVVDDAKRLLIQQQSINGGPDEDLQLAIAMSISEAQSQQP